MEGTTVFKGLNVQANSTKHSDSLVSLGHGSSILSNETYKPSDASMCVHSLSLATRLAHSLDHSSTSLFKLRDRRHEHILHVDLWDGDVHALFTNPLQKCTCGTVLNSSTISSVGTGTLTFLLVDPLHAFLWNLAIPTRLRTRKTSTEEWFCRRVP